MPGKRTSAISPAPEIVHEIVDAGSWEGWEQVPGPTNPISFVDSKSYGLRLAEAAAETGSQDCVRTGQAKIAGRSIAVIFVDFRFMAGSVGISAGEQVTCTFERAGRERLPVVALIASGGTRMQEGTRAFVQMLKMTAAVKEFRNSALPYVAYLMNPTMGGTLASWGSLAHLTFAEPGAAIGFSGPRVIELITGELLDPTIQSSENLQEHGLIDAVVPREELKGRLQTFFSALETRGGQVGRSDNVPPIAEKDGPEPWAAVERSRDRRRPGGAQLLTHAWEHITYLCGDGAGGGDDPACITAIGNLHGIPTMVIAQDRNCLTGMSPAGFRKARRAIDVAGELDLPIVNIIDTAGAELSQKSEEQGLSRELANTLYALIGVRSPSISILVGQGSGGGALALTPADRVLATRNSWLSPIAPEAASVILFRSPDQAARLARTQSIGASDLLRDGIVDVVIPEYPTASDEGAAFLDRVATYTSRELTDLLRIPDEERLAMRMHRHRSLA